jgi:hypothetical protein
LRYYPYRIAFDIESMLCEDNNLPVNTKTTSYMNRHELLSVSVCSNVPGFTAPVCFVRETTADECVERMVERMMEIAVEAENLMLQRFG